MVVQLPRTAEILLWVPWIPLTTATSKAAQRTVKAHQGNDSFA